MLTDPQVKKNLAANVARLLEERGISQSQLASRANESEMTISRVVRGTNDVRVGVVVRIAEAFDVSQDRLTGPPPTRILEKTG